MADLFSTNSLVAVVRELREPSTFLLDNFFPNVINDPSEEIHFDIDESKPRISPFVSPLVAGKVVASRGFTTKTFKPAYVKDKRVFKPDAPLKRSIGERIGGELTPEQRAQLRLGQELEDQLQMLTRREVVMAAEALRTGKVTVSGEGFDTVEVDFGRHEEHTDTLTSNDRWSVDHADSSPLDDIEERSAMMMNNAGVVLTDLIMAPAAWGYFRARIIARNEHEMLLGMTRSGSTTLEMAPGNGQLARRVGQLGGGGPTVWVYQDVYTDEAGQTQKMLGDYDVIGVSRQMDGTRCYAAIQDEEANYRAERFFPKSWLEPDPAVRYLMLQSAPLVVPFRVNASFCLTVHGQS